MAVYGGFSSRQSTNPIKNRPRGQTARAVAYLNHARSVGNDRVFGLVSEPCRGRVLPIGGLKEKLLAALRTGLKTVVIPAENEKDLAEIPDNVKNGLEIRPVSNMEEVLKIALVRQPTPVVWEDAEDNPPAPLSGEAEDPVVTH